MLISKKSDIYIYIKSFFFKHLYRDIKQLYFLLFKYDCFIFKSFNNKVIHLPKKIKKFSVVRSPTMSKLSKEQFQIVLHKVCFIFSYYNLGILKISTFFMPKIKLKHSYFRISYINAY